MFSLDMSIKLLRTRQEIMNRTGNRQLSVFYNMPATTINSLAIKRVTWSVSPATIIHPTFTHQCDHIRQNYASFAKLKVFGNFLSVSLVFDKILNLLGQFNDFGQILIRIK